MPLSALADAGACAVRKEFFNEHAEPDAELDLDF
jgi:hypothetical protein